MEMLRLLANDHQQIDRLLKQLQAAQEKAEQRWLFIELKHKLETHARIEEEIFYPALHGEQEGDIRIDASLAEHEAVRWLLLQMEQAIPGSHSWAENLEELKSKVEHHVQEEESELFPRARSILTPGLQEDLFERMLVRKAELPGAGVDSALRGAQSGKADRATSRTSEQAHEYSRRMGQQGKAALEQGAGAAADQTRRVADALHATSENLEKEDQEGLSRYLREAANGLNRFSNRLTRGDVDGLLQEARDTAKRNPGLLLGGAIAAGFLLARFVKSTETSPHKAPADTGSPYPIPTGTLSSAQPSSPSHPQEVR